MTVHIPKSDLPIEERQKLALIAAEDISNRFNLILTSKAGRDEKIEETRALLRELSIAFDGLQCKALDKVDMPLHTSMVDFLGVLGAD